MDDDEAYVAPSASNVIAAGNEALSLDGMKPEEASALVWQKLREFAASTQGQEGTKKLFKKFDTDGNGTLDRNEFREALALVGVTGASNKAVEIIMKAAGAEDGAKGTKKALDYACFANALAVKKIKPTLKSISLRV